MWLICFLILKNLGLNTYKEWFKSQILQLNLILGFLKFVVWVLFYFFGHYSQKRYITEIWRCKWKCIVDFLFLFISICSEMATHPSVLAWRIPGMGAWWTAIYGVAQNRTRLKRLSSSNYTESWKTTKFPIFLVPIKYSCKLI